ncbi:MAG: hypothetical protein EOM24_20285 [Chloroflexia bacterium]|nr:hypothetical protein [Chloroflexia bacterium]
MNTRERRLSLEMAKRALELAIGHLEDYQIDCTPTSKPPYALQDLVDYREAEVLANSGDQLLRQIVNKLEELSDE